MVDPILCLVGTRPEVIKMAPVIQRLCEGKEGFNVQILATGQHRSLLDQARAGSLLVDVAQEPATMGRAVQTG